MDDRLTYIGSQDTQAGGSIEDGLWLIALGAAIADKDFRDELIGGNGPGYSGRATPSRAVGVGARNPEVRNMLIALHKGDVGGVYEGAKRLGFPVNKDDRCLHSLIKSLKQRAISKKCSIVASKLEYCAKLTPENFLQMLKEVAEEMENADSKAV